MSGRELARVEVLGRVKAGPVDLPDHPAALQLAAVYHNLLRRWAHI
jgi:predicted 2-oxoglutarate/Fe(II)-dependent dioxygenase YbiX